jgi:hypothetical protein
MRLSRILALLELPVLCGQLLLWPSTARANTNSALVTVHLDVMSSISLIFQNNPSVGTSGFCPLSNAGTNDVGLDLGTASLVGGDNVACVAFTNLILSYRVSSAFDVVVTKANSSSPNYRLGAQLSVAPPANVTWMVNGTALNALTFSTLDAADNYSTAITKTLQVQVGTLVPAQVLSETITFLATAN